MGRFLAEPNLAKSIGCIYLVKIPFDDNSYYIKVGISKYLNAAKRKSSLPTGTIILGSQQAELHRCFQAEQLASKKPTSKSPYTHLWGTSARIFVNIEPVRIRAFFS